MMNHVVQRSAQARRLTTVISAIVALLAVSIAPSSASAADDSQPGTSARQAFKSARFPWYDAETDSLKPINLPAPAADPQRRWKLPSLPSAPFVWGALIVLGVVLVAVVVLMLRDRGHARKSGGDRETSPQPADSVEALPFLAARPRGDLLGEARRHYEQGNYGEAIIYLFSYELVQLDKVSLVHLARGKTNRQYLRELTSARDFRRLLEHSMTTFEGVFFGSRALDRAGFEACWNELPQFENLLTQVTP